MLIGYNTDVTHDGKVYHVQTEDSGRANPVIVTLLYEGGKVLSSLKTGYADILKYDGLDSIVRDLMDEQHKRMISDLTTGRIGIK